MTNAVGDKENEFNTWYDNQHIPDVLNVLGFVGAKRYVQADSQMGAVSHKYICVYDIDTDDLNATLADFGSKAGTDKMVMSDAVDVATAQMGFYREMD